MTNGRGQEAGEQRGGGAEKQGRMRGEGGAFPMRVNLRLATAG